ncbi:MAG: polysaccharide ABC transporter ATP-binding protein [Vicinamibacterales bacterium]
MSLVTFDHVSKSYRLGLHRFSLANLAWRSVQRVVLPAALRPPDQDFWALRDVTFELPPGESLALLGANGAGKSTILKLLARITLPTSGRVTVNGQLAALIELGAGFHPDLTGRENVFLNGALLGLRRPEIQRRFDDIVSFAELERFIDTPIKRYSSGMTVRLGFAVASCIEPDILLVDEVLAVGDAAFRQKCVRRIKELLTSGTSLIFVSHDMALVKAICRTAIYVDEGAVKHRGPTGEVIDVYNRTLDRRRAAALRRDDQPADTEPAAEITRIQVLKPNDSQTTMFSSGDEVEVRVSVVVYRPLLQANVLVRIYRSDGVSCCVVRTSDDGGAMSLGRGEGTVSVVLEPLQLFSGTYYAVGWITGVADSGGICRATSDWFEVVGARPGLDPDDGVFEPRRRWVHRVGPVAGAP